MVDTALFLSMSGAKETMRALQMNANNLANANTIGFQADYETMKPYSGNTSGLQSRVYTTKGMGYSDFTPGPMIETGNELDIAIDGPGFIAVQTKSGQVGFTRAGNLKLTPDGFLTTSKGAMVLSDKGVINIPPATKINININGSLSAQLQGQNPNELTQLGNIRLVDIPVKSLKKGEDGLFYPTDGNTALSDISAVKVKQHFLEGSNVDTVFALTQLIDMSRQFDMHSKAMKTIEENSLEANQLLNISL